MSTRRKANLSLPARGGRPASYANLLTEIKSRIRQGRTRAILSANAEMIGMYWDVGRILVLRKAAEGWGARVLHRLSMDLQNELPEVKGFSERNLKLMVQFFREYARFGEIGQPAVAQLPPRGAASESKTNPIGSIQSGGSILQQLVAQLPWAHNILLIQRVKDLKKRLWYVQQTIAQGWSRNVLLMMIQSEAHKRQGRVVSNFSRRLPPEQSDLATQTLKDPYVFDFLTLAEPYRERELETTLLKHLEKFLVELGRGFAFVGRQYHLDIGGEDFYIDLLFYHLRLRCFVVIDLKKGAFKPEHAGKMNFYLNVVDEQLRHSTDNASIGLILCQEKQRVVAEYALRGMNKPIGISEYELTRALPATLKSSLPSIKQIEDELTSGASGSRRAKPMAPRGGKVSKQCRE